MDLKRREKIKFILALDSLLEKEDLINFGDIDLDFNVKKAITGLCQQALSDYADDLWNEDNPRNNQQQQQQPQNLTALVDIITNAVKASLGQPAQSAPVPQPLANAAAQALGAVSDSFNDNVNPHTAGYPTAYKPSRTRGSPVLDALRNQGVELASLPPEQRVEVLKNMETNVKAQAK